TRSPVLCATPCRGYASTATRCPVSHSPAVRGRGSRGRAPSLRRGSVVRHIGLAGNHIRRVYTLRVTGTDLRRLRRRLRLTQRELAARAGVPGTTIARKNRDEVRIPEPMARLFTFLATMPRTPKGGRRR